METFDSFLPMLKAGGVLALAIALSHGLMSLLRSAKVKVSPDMLGVVSTICEKVVMAIEQAHGDLMRARHRLSKMLLRRDLRWAGPGSAWTQKHMSWLRTLRFEDVCSHATFVDYLSGVEMLLARRAALLAALEQARLDPGRQPAGFRRRAGPSHAWHHSRSPLRPRHQRLPGRGCG